MIKSIGLKNELPIRLELDNKGTIDVIVNGRTKHIQYNYIWFGDMQEKEIVDMQWVKGDNNEIDIQIRNVV